jgi:signal peptidase I
MGLAILLIFQFGYALSKGEVPTVFNRAVAYVPNASMEDEILAKDLIIIHTKYDEITEGDIITFTASVNGNRISVTHKVIAINDGSYTTWGINNKDVDGNPIIYDWERDIEPDQVIGIYKGQRSHFLGSLYASLFSNSFNILFVIIFLVFLAIIILEIINIVKMINSKKLEEEKERLIAEAKKKLRENGDQT